MPNDNNNQTTNPNDQALTTSDDQTPKINPVVEEVLPPMPQEPVISTEETGVSKAQEEPKTDAVDVTPATVAHDSGSAAPNQDLLNPQVMGTVMPKKKFGGGRVIATILGLFLLVGGVGAGIMLTGQDQNISEKAGGGKNVGETCQIDKDNPAPEGNCNPGLVCHCSKGQECLDKDRVCEEEKTTKVWCDAQTDREWCVNSGGKGMTCCDCGYKCDPGGKDGCFKDDSIKCDSTTPPRPECFAVLALYDSSDRIITDLGTLKAGQKVFITVPPSYKTVSATKTRFTINGVLGAEVTAKRNFGNVPLFYQEYTVKSGQTTVKAEMYYQGQWY